MIHARRGTLFLVLALGLLAGCRDHDLITAPMPGGPNMLTVVLPNSFTQVGAGGLHTCALRSDGVVECWGPDGSGQAPATKTAESGTFTQVSGGLTHTCALRSDGVVECWGDNYSGQAPATKTAPSGTTFTQVGGGYIHTCALRSDGVVECWGSAGSPQAPATRSAPSGTTFTQVSVGGFHTCALRSDGVVECWGWTGNGQAPATRPAESGTFTQVGAGGYHTCALRSDGVVECWGFNWPGQAPPTKSAASSTFTQVSAGENHTCALRSDGVVECWGEDGYGQAPATRTAATGTFTQMGAGLRHTCAARSDGVVECWGRNDDGEAPATRSATGIAVTVLPTATFSAPASVQAGQNFTLELTNAQVPGHPSATSFSYAFDCGDGAGYGSFGPSSSVSCPTSTAGTRSVKGTVRDQDLDQSEYTATVEVTAAPGGFTFGGFFAPVRNQPTVNVARAGSAIPLKFSLGGNHGLAIFASGSPSSQAFICGTSTPTGPPSPIGTAGGSKLSYAAGNGRYSYVWKTNKAWANSCRTLTLTFTDGTTQTASFRFTR